MKCMNTKTFSGTRSWDDFNQSFPQIKKQGGVGESPIRMAILDRIDRILHIRIKDLGTQLSQYHALPHLLIQTVRNEVSFPEHCPHLAYPLTLRLGQRTDYRNVGTFTLYRMFGNTRSWPSPRTES
jgi:hypothetical protein